MTSYVCVFLLALFIPLVSAQLTIRRRDGTQEGTEYVDEDNVVIAKCHKIRKRKMIPEGLSIYEAEACNMFYCDLEKVGIVVNGKQPSDGRDHTCYMQYQQICACESDGGVIKPIDKNKKNCPCTWEPCAALYIEELGKASVLRKIINMKMNHTACNEICDPSDSPTTARKKRDDDSCTYTRECVFDGSCCEGYMEVCVDPDADTSVPNTFPTCYSAEEGCCDFGGCCTGAICG